MLLPSPRPAIVRLADVITDPYGIWFAPSPNRLSKRTDQAGAVAEAPPSTTVAVAA